MQNKPFNPSKNTVSQRKLLANNTIKQQPTTLILPKSTTYNQNNQNTQANNMQVNQSTPKPITNNTYNNTNQQPLLTKTTKANKHPNSNIEQNPNQPKQHHNKSKPNKSKLRCHKQSTQIKIPKTNTSKQHKQCIIQ